MVNSSLNRFSSLQLNELHRLRNRVVVPPMASQTASPGGFVTDETLKHYKRLTESQAGLVIAEYSFVHTSGKSEESQLGISSEAHVQGLAKLAKVIHQAGALAGIQLSHGGGKSDSSLTQGPLMGPSAVAVPVKDRVLETPRAMISEDIELWQKAFVEAAGRAFQAGFDLVELHSAHGYGLNQWLSPLTNQRLDPYGFHLQGRLRLLKEIIAQIQLKYPPLLLSVRLPGQDFLEGGLRVEEMIRVAQELEKQGVHLIHVSSGIGGWRRPSTRQGEGYLVDEAAQIQKQISVPVIGVGGIESGEYIDAKIQAGDISLAAVGRAILKDPAAWFEKVLERKNLCL